MTTSDYLMLAIYNQREEEMVRNLERKRIAAERRASSRVPVEHRPGLLSAFMLRFNSLQSAVRHQTARS